MKNDKLVEFIETTFGVGKSIKISIFKHRINVQFEEGDLNFYEDGEVLVNALFNINDLEALHKICVAIKNNIFK